jgi:RNA polymerase sigma-70 factor (ECF subfamily)
LLERCAGKLLALIRLRLGPSLRAEVESRDVLQSTLLKALTRFADFEGGERGSLMAWLARIAENEIRDLADFHGRQRRDAACRVSFDENPEVARLSARVRSQTSRIALGEDLAQLEGALRTLTSEHREAILLRSLEELSFAEMAERLGRSPDACRMLYARAMTALTIAMSPAAVGPRTTDARPRADGDTMPDALCRAVSCPPNPDAPRP